MPDTTHHMPSLARRELLKVGLLGSLFLAGAGAIASLGGCSAASPASGMRQVRESDLPLLRALIPVLLAGAVPAARMPEAIERTLEGLDHSLDHLSPAMLELTLQLFDSLTLPVTRGPLSGVWGRWENASTQDVEAFLERWRNSSLGLLKTGHAALLQLVGMAWYGNPESWRHCGYPGPPKI